MSRQWTTANVANYLDYDSGADSAISFPYSYGCFVKSTATPVTSTTPICFSGADIPTGSRFVITNADHGINFESANGTSENSRDFLNAFTTKNTWIPVVVVVASATSRTVYWSSNANSESSTADIGSVPTIRYLRVGVTKRHTETATVGADNMLIARVARWHGVALTSQEVQDFMDGTVPQQASLWGWWPMEDDSLTDESGNGRTLTVVGTVASNTDDPYTSAASLVPVASPLYYGATLLANKTRIEWELNSGHTGLAGELLGTGTAATTDESGNIQIPAGAYGTAADPVTLSLYWEEGTDPIVDRSLIVKTTLVAA